MRLKDRLFACGIAEIAAAEVSVPISSCRCLVPREGDAADAVAEVFLRRCERVDREGENGTVYHLIVLLHENDESALCGFFHRETLVLDAVQTPRHTAVFHPNVPFRRIRILALQDNTAKQK